jgi:outer membrane protein OmpA-like peptidoglycan-associated protein
MPESSDRRPASGDTFADLRSIIVGPEQRELVALRARLEPTVQTREVSRVLPDALQLRARDPQLMRALAPSIEDAITASVKKDPQPLADALFPVIGPAIRKAVAHTFDAMLESLNQTLERTVSWRAVRWRLTAWRTGRPYAEIVLANTLEYRVEQIFLIHRESGLLLQHLTNQADADRDPDQISAMLTAITDFARDSFRVGRADALESLRVGDLTVAVVQGPHAIVAAVVRGSAPLTVRAALENALESIHRQFGPALQTYNGDSTTFVEALPILQACLLSQRRQPYRRGVSLRWWLLAATVLLAAAGVWFLRDLRAERAWNAYLDRLASEPGIVVLSHDRRGGRFLVGGLRDPLAADPASLVDASSPLIPDSIDSHWEPYQALHPPFVTARAALLLRPPDGVSLTFDDGLLTATGSASERWIGDSERLAFAIAGVRRFVFAGESAETRLTMQIEAASIRFEKGQSSIPSAQQPALAAVVERLKELDAVLASSGRRARIEILGQADSDGPDDLNAVLSEARAHRVLAVVRAAALQQIELSARGLGRAPRALSTTEAEQERDRRASFVIRMIGNPTSPGGRP